MDTLQPQRPRTVPVGRSESPKKANDMDRSDDCTGDSQYTAGCLAIHVKK